MKTHSFKSIIVASGLVLAATSPVFGSDAETMFKHMDTDGNGKVTAVEHAVFSETMFKQADANYDGQISAMECNTAAAAQGQKVSQKATVTHIQMVDTDGNGQISAAENEVFARSSFTRADRNNDGTLSEDEVEDAHQAMKKEMKD